MGLFTLLNGQRKRLLQLSLGLQVFFTGFCKSLVSLFDALEGYSCDIHLRSKEGI